MTPQKTVAAAPKALTPASAANTPAAEFRPDFKMGQSFTFPILGIAPQKNK